MNKAFINLHRCPPNGNRTVDYLVARAMGLPLSNPFTAYPTMVEEIDNEWLVARSTTWQPLPYFTTSTDAAISAARGIHPGVMVDIEELGIDQYRATLRLGGVTSIGMTMATRPLAVLAAVLQRQDDFLNAPMPLAA